MRTQRSSDRDQSWRLSRSQWSGGVADHALYRHWRRGPFGATRTTMFTGINAPTGLDWASWRRSGRPFGRSPSPPILARARPLLVGLSVLTEASALTLVLGPICVSSLNPNGSSPFSRTPCPKYILSSRPRSLSSSSLKAFPIVNVRSWIEGGSV